MGPQAQAGRDIKAQVCSLNSLKRNQDGILKYPFKKTKVPGKQEDNQTNMQEFRPACNRPDSSFGYIFHFGSVGSLIRRA